MIIPEKIKIKSIRLINGSIDCPQEVAESNPLINNCATDFEADFNINLPTKSINFFLRVMLQALNENQELIAVRANYAFEFTFQIDNLSDYIIEASQDGTIVIEEVLAHTLMSITYSGVRGLILARTEGTILGGVILPVIDPKLLLLHKAEKK